MYGHIIIVNVTLLSVGDYQQRSLVIQISSHNFKQLELYYL